MHKNKIPVFISSYIWENETNSKTPKNKHYMEHMLLHIALLLLLIRFSSCLTLCNPLDGSPPGSPSLGFSRQEHWSGLPFPSPMRESENESEVAQSCLTLNDLMDCSIPGSSVHGIFQARVLGWGAIAFSVHVALVVPRMVCVCAKIQMLKVKHMTHQFSSVTQSCPTLCDLMNHSTPGLPVHHQLLESTQTHVHLVGDAIQPSYPLLSPSPPALSLSQHQGLFQWVSSSHQVVTVLEFQLQHQSFQWTPGLISFRRDWLDLLAVQGTLKSLLQYHSSKASIFRCSAFFIVQCSHPYMTTGKTIASTRQTFVGKVCVCFLICCLSWSWLSFQGESIF